jgi:hypothetical protein
MNSTIDLLARGGEKVIGHYRWLLQRTEDDEERAAYERRIAEEERLLASARLDAAKSGTGPLRAR